VPAIQLFTGPTPDYHRPSDTAETIDADGMVTVTAAAHEAVGYLAERTDPLTVTIAGTGPPTAPAALAGQGGRRASLGTMPDFSFEGEGVRVQQVMPESGAEKAGIVAGDVIMALDDEEVTDLRSLSNILKSRAPGDSVRVKVLRDGEVITVSAMLGAR
jgi:S1-C subfamily serine protease